MKNNRLNLLPRIYLMTFMSAFGEGSSAFLIPIFAQSLGGSYVDIGMISAAQSLGFLSLAIIGGYFSDKMNRTHLIAAGLGLRASAIVLLHWASTVFQIAVLRAITGIGMAFFYPSNNTMASQIGSNKERIRVLSMISASLTAGLLLGPLVGGYLAELLGIRYLFLISASSMVVAACISVFWIAPDYIQKKNPSGSLEDGFRIIIRNFRTLAVIGIPLGSAAGIMIAIFPAYAHSLDLLPPAIGGLFVIYRVGWMTGSLTAKRISSYGEQVSIIVPGVILIFSFLHLALITTWPLIALSLFGVGYSIGLLFPIMLSMATKMPPSGRMGITIGAFEALIAAGFTVGPTLSGPLAEYVWPSSPFLLAAFLGVVLVITGTRRPPSSS